MIDFHCHIGRLYREDYPRVPYFTAEQCVDRMNREGIEISVLLPLESPEGGWGYLLTDECIAARDKYPERFVAFMCIDPRYPKVERLFDVFVKQYDCKGFGEHIPGLPFDHELNKVIYRKCAEYNMAMVMDICGGGLTDEPGLPRLEACLKEFPDCMFVGHGPGFWTNISGDVHEGSMYTYAKGRIAANGAVDRMLGEYDNLYADLSAGSGWNALTRDPEYTPGFVERHWGKLLMGTDVCKHGVEYPQVGWVNGIENAEWREAIARGNAVRLLKLEGYDKCTP
ncbi:MAG: amidohydrolase family protein [Armatimonadia bacterium]